MFSIQVDEIRGPRPPFHLQLRSTASQVGLDQIQERFRAVVVLKNDNFSK